MNFTTGISIMLSCLFGISCCNNFLLLSFISKEFFFSHTRKTSPGPKLYSLIDQALSIFMALSMIEMIWGIQTHIWENLKIIGYFSLSCWYAYRIFHHRQHSRKVNIPHRSPKALQSATSGLTRPETPMLLLFCCEMMLAMSWMLLCMKLFPLTHIHHHKYLSTDQSILDHSSIMRLHHSLQIIPRLNLTSHFPWWMVIITLILAFTTIISAVRILYIAPHRIANISGKFIQTPRHNLVASRHITKYYLNSICEAGVQFGMAYMLLFMIS